MNRFKLQLFTMFVVAVAAFSSGIGITYAQQDPAAATPAVAPDPAAAQRKAAAAVRARAQRDAAIQKRHAAKQYIQKVVESGATATAPSGGEK